MAYRSGMARDVATPPAWRGRLRDVVDRVFDVKQEGFRSALRDADTAKGYLHWDAFRHKETPSGWTSDDLWTLLRWERSNASRPLPLLLRKTGEPFFLNPSDPLLAALHRIDNRATLWSALRDVNAPDEQVSYRLMAAIEEAHHSSAIEGAVTTRRQSRELIRTGRRPRNRSEQMVLNNFRTIERLEEWSQQSLTPELVCSIQTSITTDTLDDVGDVGCLRTDDEVHVIDGITGDVIYTPPPARELAERMERLCRFANEESTDELFLHPVTRAILLHHQLAYDHPFGDGNGRTARALFLWSILRSGYRWFRSLSISRAVNRARTQYYRTFHYVQTDEGDVTYFVRHQLRCIEKEIEFLAEFLARRAALERWLEAKKAISTTLNARQVALVEYALDNPDADFTALEHGRFHGVTKVTGWSDLKGLVREKLLREKKVGREIHYLPTGKLRALGGDRPKETRRSRRSKSDSGR
jgi:Fic family protein